MSAAVALMGCNDPSVPMGQPTEGSSGGGSGTTDGADVTGTTSEGSTTAPGASTAADPSSGTTGTDSTSTGSGDTRGSSSDDGTTNGAAFDVPFVVLEPTGLPLTVRVQPGWTLITSAAEWSAQTTAPVPMGVSFPEHWLLYGSHGPLPFPGHALAIDTLTWDGGILAVEGDAVEPAPDCETFQFTWPADTLLRIDALEVDIDAFDDQTAAAPRSCAAGGGDSASCDLATPCATGLVCAGLVRSTVLTSSPGGLCLPITYSGVFTGGALPIPTDGAIAEASLAVGGLTTVDMDVVIWLELDHPAPSELVIELRNPDGNQVSVANLQASPLHPGGVGIVPTGFSGDESVNGLWWLVVRDDVVNGSNGSVVSWELEIMSRFD